MNFEKIRFYYIHIYREKKKKETSKSSKHHEWEMGHAACGGVPVSDPKIVRKEIAIFSTFEAQGTQNLEELLL